MKFGLAIFVAGAVGAFTASASMADTIGQSTFFAGGHAAQLCASAAADARNTGRATDAQVTACSRAIDMAGSSPARLAAAYTNRGILHLVRADYQDSLADSDAALKIDATLVEPVVNRGVALLMQHRPADATAQFTHALALNASDQARIYFNRAMAREDSGDLRGAYADYREASRLQPQWDRPKQELARFTVTPRTPVS